MGYERISGVTLPITTFGAKQTASKPTTLLTRKRATVGKPELFRQGQTGKTLPAPMRRVIASVTLPKKSPGATTRPVKTPKKQKTLVLSSKPGGGTTYSGVMVGPPPPQDTATKDPKVSYSAAWTPEGPTLEALEFERAVGEGVTESESVTVAPQPAQVEAAPKKGISGKTAAMLIGGGLLAYYLARK